MPIQNPINVVNSATSLPFTLGSSVAIGTGPGTGAITIQVTGTFSLTLHVAASLDGQNFVQLPDSTIINSATGAAGAITAPGMYTVPVPAAYAYVYCGSFVSGSATVTVASGLGTTTPGESGGGGGGSGFAWSQDVAYAQASPAGVSAHVAKSSAATLGGWIVNNYSSSEQLFFQLFNQTTLPTTTVTAPTMEWPIGIGVNNSPTSANLGAGYWGPGGLSDKFTNGLTWALSSTSGVYTSVATGLASVEVDYR